MKNILFIRLRLLGDIVFTIPAVQIYKKHFPGDNIYYVAEEKFREIAQLIPGIHKVIVIPRKMSLKEMWQFRKNIKKIGIDRVIDFHSGPKSAQLTFISGAKTRIGYKTPNRGWAYNRLTQRKLNRTYTHSVYNQAKLLEHLGIPVNMDTLPGYPAITPTENKVSIFLKERLENSKKKQRVIIHVGAGNDFRDWGIEKFSTLIGKLKQDGLRVFLIGNGEEEKKKGVYLNDRHPLDDLTGRLSVNDVLYLVSKSAVYLGADSGPLHLASLTATPIVALYGPNLPEISGPWRKKDVTIIRKPMDCQPCDQRRCIYGIIPCMKNITTDEVYEAIIRHIK